MTQINKVLFIGSKEVGLKCAAEMHALHPSSLAGIMTIDDRQDSRSVYEKFISFSSSISTKLFAPKNRKDFAKMILQIKPDLCIVAGWYWLIDRDTLDAVPNGFIGFHNSLLPKYRGGSPLVWTMINGEERAGVSMFSFTEGMDEGDIWGQRSVKIEFSDYIADILLELENETISLLREKYIDILEGKIKPVKQNHNDATYCAQRFPFDGMIDWNKSSMEIYNFIRAQSEPYPGAFTFYEKQKLFIWKAHPENIAYYGTPGQVAKISDKGVYVICGDMKPIVLEIIQMEKRRDLAHKIITSVKTRFTYTAIYKEILLDMLNDPETREAIQHKEKLEI